MAGNDINSGKKCNSNNAGSFKTKKHIGVDTISKFKLSIHNTNGYMYASTQEPFLDKKTNTIKYSYIHWGTLSNDLTFYPNERFFFTKPEIRNKLIYPVEWNLGEIYTLMRNFSYNPIILREKTSVRKKEKIKC